MTESSRPRWVPPRAATPRLGSPGPSSPRLTPDRWSAQFLAMLESLRMPTQFQQGRRLARAGEVRHLTISTSLAGAHVLDPAGETYRVKIAVRAFSGGDWNRIERALAQQAIYAARLLAGQLPDDIGDVLSGFGLALFPESLDELAMDCSCPGWQVPCAHLAATFYALAEAFDHDPFTILAWRGRSRDELLDRLQLLRVEPVPLDVEPAPTVDRPDFWSPGPRASAPPVDPAAAAQARRPDALLDQLDPLSLNAGRFDVTDLLRAAYPAITGDESPDRPTE